MRQEEHKRIFEDWLRRHKGIIFKVLRAYAFTSMDREDLFQEIVLQVWKSVPRFRKESSDTTWIYRISLNMAIKWSQKERRYRRPEPMDHLQHLIQETPVPGNDRVVWLYEQIARLDEIDRSIALLLLDNFNYREMAAILGITESNLGVKINRIKKQLILKSKNVELWN